MIRKAPAIFAAAMAAWPAFAQDQDAGVDYAGFAALVRHLALTRHDQLRRRDERRATTKSAA